jgi:phosphate/sulfate permease
MDPNFTLLLVVVGFGLAFEFVNGFHDAANAVATIIATRVLSPLGAVLMAGVLNGRMIAPDCTLARFLSSLLPSALADHKPSSQKLQQN